jgi:hypothetical protein
MGTAPVTAPRAISGAPDEKTHHLVMMRFYVKGVVGFVPVY